MLLEHALDSKSNSAVLYIVGQLKPSASSMDAIPPFLLKQLFDAVGPYLLNKINRCLGTSTVPTILKHAIIRSLLKKPNLDLNVLANFRHCF